MKRLFFDIETAANLEALAFAPDPKAPANLKDPEKIAAAIEEKRRELIENAALDPDYGRILSIGFSVGGDEIEVYQVGQPLEPDQFPPEEAGVIDLFWERFRACAGCCIGYNILGFDLPYLLRRSMALGIKVPVMPSLARYRVEPVTDLMMILYNWGADRYKGLKQVAKLYGIPNDCPDVDGSMVKDLAPDVLRQYQISDVKLVIELFKRMNGVYFNL